MDVGIARQMALHTAGATVQHQSGFKELPNAPACAGYLDCYLTYYLTQPGL